MSLDMKTTLGHVTHEVFNQVPPLVNYNLFEQDMTLDESVRREGAAWITDHVPALGKVAGSEEAIQWSFDANTVTHVLHTHDRSGQRIDEATFHPGWHNLMRTSINAGAHALSWREEQAGSHLARTPGFYILSRIEDGRCWRGSKPNPHVYVLLLPPPPPPTLQTLTPYLPH